ncbi:MAG: TolC family protein [Planctomycetota bacterium]
MCTRLGTTRKAFLCTAVLLGGCIGPLDRYGGADVALRNAVITENRKELLALSDERGRPTVIEVQRETSDVEARLDTYRLQELNQISGAEAYAGVVVEPGADLAGQTELEIVRLSLDEAVRMAVTGNLDLAVARLLPQIGEEQLTQAAAAFDAVFFLDFNFQTLDVPQPAGTIPGLANDIKQENTVLQTGIRQNLVTGGQVQLDTTIARNERIPSFFAVDDFYDADVLVTLNQPLLRGFGRDVATADIVLARNSALDARAQLRQALSELINDVEQTYWNLNFTQRQVLIQQRLLDRTIAERDRLQQRADFDVSPVRITEANSRVELRKADLIRVRADVRNASDALKRLLNAPSLPLADETLVLPSDAPVDAPVSFSLLDSVTTALEKRAVLEQSLLAIDDAQVQQRLADNATLPLFDLTAALGINGIDEDDAGSAYGEIFDGDFVDYIIGVAFEQPLGNRSAEALLRQRNFEESQAILAYRRDAQDVVLEVKNALRGVLTNYELVGATRAARWAAADSLRSINVQEEVGVALTDEFLLDLKLNAQERLADAESQEAQALANYMIAIAEMQRSMGTLAERYSVDVRQDP